MFGSDRRSSKTSGWMPKQDFLEYYSAVGKLARALKKARAQSVISFVLYKAMCYKVCDKDLSVNEFLNSSFICLLRNSK